MDGINEDVYVAIGERGYVLSLDGDRLIPKSGGVYFEQASETANGVVYETKAGACGEWPLKSGKNAILSPLPNYQYVDSGAYVHNSLTHVIFDDQFQELPSTEDNEDMLFCQPLVVHVTKNKMVVIDAAAPQRPYIIREYERDAWRMLEKHVPVKGDIPTQVEGRFHAMGDVFLCIGLSKVGFHELYTFHYQTGTWRQVSDFHEEGVNKRLICTSLVANITWNHSRWVLKSINSLLWT